MSKWKENDSVCRLFTNYTIAGLADRQLKEKISNS